MIFFPMLLIYAIVLGAAIVVRVAASPTNALPKIVIRPRIIYPKAGTTWFPGSAHNVTWDTSNLPLNQRGLTGIILLGYNGTESENLDIAHPLATSFSLAHGSVLVVVPKRITPRDDYFVVLFGDSGNRSDKFRICAA